MKSGKKSVAKRIYADMLKEIKLAGHMNPDIVVETAIDNAAPNLMIKSKRMGGSVYQVPVEVKQDKKLFFAFKWILDGTKSKKGKPMHKRLAEEILSAYFNDMQSRKKKRRIRWQKRIRLLHIWRSI